ncbi:MAG: ABC transporter permease [Chloroflexota bacterium]
MHDLTNALVLTTLLTGAVAAGMPLLCASLGELIAQRAGILNIGIEGMMLAGAYAGFVGAYAGHAAGWGFLAGAAAGAGLSLAVIVLCVRGGLDQIVVGIALTVGAGGITSVLHGAQYGSSYPRLGATATLALPGLSRLPIVGNSIFTQPLPAYLGLAAAIVTHWMLVSTAPGLAIRAAGAQPETLDAAGVSVVATRSWAEVAAGALVGLGGAYLAVVDAGIFVPAMTHGQGFIALVIAMLARGRPLWAVLGSFVFGLALSLQTVLQLTGIGLSTDLVTMVPFAAVMITLILFGRKAYLPRALGRPYVRGAR